LTGHPVSIPKVGSATRKRPDPNLTARTHQLLGQQLLIGQHGPIFGGQHLVRKSLERVVGLGDALGCAERNSRTNGSLMASSGVTASALVACSAVSSIAALFLDNAVRS